MRRLLPLVLFLSSSCAPGPASAPDAGPPDAGPSLCDERVALAACAIEPTLECGDDEIPLLASDEVRCERGCAEVSGAQLACVADTGEPVSLAPVAVLDRCTGTVYLFSNGRGSQAVIDYPDRFESTSPEGRSCDP